MFDMMEPFKINVCSVEGELLLLLKNYPENREQRVVLTRSLPKGFQKQDLLCI